MLTATQYAEKYGLSKQWAARLAKEGRIVGAVLHGRTWLIPEDAPEPVRLPRGPVPSLSASRARRAAEAAQRRADYEAGIVRPKAKTQALSPYDRFWADAKAQGMRRVERWLEYIDFQEWAGPAWMEDETAEQFAERDRIWREWDKEGRPAELTPADFAAFLAK